MDIKQKLERSARYASRRQVLALAAAALASPAAAQESAAFLGLPKAMWVWKDPILNPGNLAAFARAQKIQTLFLYTSPAAAEALLAQDRTATASLLALRAEGCRLYAMAGEPDWAAGITALPSHVQLLIKLQGTATKLFDGIHFDVEPNALPNWKDPAGKNALIAGTVAFYALLRKNAPGVAIDAAVNCVFADLQTADGGNFLSRIVQNVNSISVMAYRNNIAKAVAWASPSIAKLAGTPVRWRMGVNVDPDPAEPTTTWANAGKAQFTAQMVPLDQMSRGLAAASYDGLVFESFDGMQALLAS